MLHVSSAAQIYIYFHLKVYFCVCVGLVFNYQMLKHECDCKDTSFYPGFADIIMSIWSRLQECGFSNQCEVNNAEQLMKL